MLLWCHSSEDYIMPSNCYVFVEEETGEEETKEEEEEEETETEE